MGRVSPDITAVDVAFNGAAVRAQLSQVPAAARAQVGVTRPFKVFAAFSTEFSGGEIRVSARNAAGEIVASEKLMLPDFTALQKRLGPLR